MNRNLEKNKDAMFFIDNQVSFLNEQSQTFLKQYGLGYFSYMRFYNKGKIFRLSSSKEWNPHFFSERIYADLDTFQKRAASTKDGETKHYFEISNSNISPEMKHFFNFTNLSNSFFKHVGYKDFVEITTFCSDNSHFISSFLQNAEGPDLFLKDFKKEISRKINLNDNQFLIQSPDECQAYMDQRSKEDRFDRILQSFSEKHGIRLTKKQFQIIILSLYGRTSKEIARSLSNSLGKISYRTVEDHWRNIYQQYQLEKEYTPLRSEVIKSLIEVLYDSGYRNLVELEAIALSTLERETF
tara:strand:- start:308 stop:1201 length:894 start_codon:yes stop_codon:yes gene_type:complete